MATSPERQTPAACPGGVMQPTIKRPTMVVNLGLLAKAFEAWETGYRVHPEHYLTDEQCAAASIRAVSADRAAYFLKLLEVLE